MMMRKLTAKFATRLLCLLLVSLGVHPGSRAQTTTLPDNLAPAPSDPNPPPSQADSDSTVSLMLFPHSETSRWWISGQGNIFQWHPAFPAACSGPNSLRNKSESATSQVFTLYLG
jgi:hypothetical protein